METPQATQVVAKAIGSSLQTDSRAPLPRTTLSFTDCEEVELAPTWSICPYVREPSGQEGTLQDIK